MGLREESETFKSVYDLYQQSSLTTRVNGSLDY